MVMKIILIIVAVVIIINSPFEPGDFSTASTTDVYKFLFTYLFVTLWFIFYILHFSNSLFNSNLYVYIKTRVDFMLCVLISVIIIINISNFIFVISRFVFVVIAHIISYCYYYLQFIITDIIIDIIINIILFFQHLYSGCSCYCHFFC